MRLYVPASLDELDAVTVTGNSALWTLAPRTAHAVTDQLRAELADTDPDEESLEYAAALEAADDSLALIAARPGAPLQRLVLTVDVPDDAVGPGRAASHQPTDLDEIAASAVHVLRTVVEVAIICVHVDEPEAADDVRAVLTAADADEVLEIGGELDIAIDRVTQRDLLWYDWSELGSIPRV